MANGSNRPLSPHLQIYRLPPTALTSIIHRATGVALGIGTLLLTWWLVAGATSPAAFNLVQDFMGSPIGYLVLFGWSWALFYHLANGIRHLVWDAGYAFELKSVQQGVYIVVGASVGLTLAAWIAALIVM